jgi:hypothetical protein
LVRVVKDDMEYLGYAVSVTSVDPDLANPDPDQSLFCVRCGHEDFHFMRKNFDDGYWYHKPGPTAILKYRHHPADKIWNDEYSYDRVEYKGIPAYESDIYYLTLSGTPQAVTIPGIQGVTPPLAWETPVTEIAETSQYTGTVAWYPDDPVFAAGTQYAAAITLWPKTGYAMYDVESNFFTVAGAEANNAEHSGNVTAVFPVTPPQTVTASAIPGVSVLAGRVPACFIETEQYSGTVAWHPNDPVFAAGTQYAAAVTLAAKQGYTLRGVPRDFFTVAGAQTRNHRNSGIVRAEFPAVVGSFDIVIDARIQLKNMGTTRYSPYGTIGAFSLFEDGA